MGKGDKKSKRGKLIMGSFGISRKKRKTNKAHAYNPVTTQPKKKEVVKKAAKPAKPAAEVTEELIINTEAAVAEVPKKAKAKAAPKKATEGTEEAPKKETKKKAPKKEEE
jgi:ribosomal small subunit protein bTHX